MRSWGVQPASGAIDLERSMFPSTKSIASGLGCVLRAYGSPRSSVMAAISPWAFKKKSTVRIQHSGRSRVRRRPGHGRRRTQTEPARLEPDRKRRSLLRLERLGEERRYHGFGFRAICSTNSQSLTRATREDNLESKRDAFEDRHEHAQ